MPAPNWTITGSIVTENKIWFSTSEREDLDTKKKLSTWMKKWLSFLSMFFPYKPESVQCVLFRNISFQRAVFVRLVHFVFILFPKHFVTFHCNWIWQNADTLFYRTASAKGESKLCFLFIEEGLILELELRLNILKMLHGIHYFS